MPYSALLFGAIGVLTETSDLQRRAFNRAFDEHGLDWHWDEQTYRKLLKSPGGKNRIREWAAKHAVEVDDDAIYDSKVAAFEALASEGLELRPGVADLIAEARAQNMKVGFVSATDPRQVALIVKGLRPDLDPSVFDYIGDKTRAARPKPAPDIYNDALRELEVEADAALAIEDTPESARAAVEAGIATLGYPGAMAEGRDFGETVEVVDRLDVALLRDEPAVA